MELTFAQALNEAKQVIVQQAGRIKTDADKIRVQQDMLMSQGTTIGEQEKRLREQADEIQKLTAAHAELTRQLTETTTAREQAEAIINRQGERVQTLQATIVELEKKVGMQSEQLHDLQQVKETLLEKLPTQEDAEALAAMSALLSKKGQAPSSRSAPPIRIAEAA